MNQVSVAVGAVVVVVEAEVATTNLKEMRIRRR